MFFALALIASACGGGSDGDSTDDADAPDSASVDDTDTDSDTDDDAGTVDESTGVDESADGSELTVDDTETVAAGGTLRMGLEAEPETLNPAAAPFATGANTMGTAIFDTLTAWDENDQWVNNLSESWTPNDDFTEWDMKLRPGILFSDGTPLDAAAVVRNLEEQSVSPLLGLFYGPLFAADVPFEQIDELTVRIRTASPNAVFPAYFPSQLGMMASPAWFDALDTDPGLNQMPIGAGPYKIESREQDSVTRLVPNENWFRTDKEILLDALEFYPIQQEATRTDQLLAGDLEVAHATDVGSITRLREEASVNRFEESEEDFFLIFNAQKAPFDDLRVRQAATHAFPRAQYAEFINQGVSVPADSLFPETSKFHDATIEQATDDPAAAAPLVDAYCADNPGNCTDGKIDIEYQNNGPSLVLDEIHTVISGAWSDYFNVTHQVIPQDEHINEVFFGLYDVATWRYHGFLDPELESLFFSCSTISGLSINFARNCNENRDALMAQQRASADEAERIELWKEIQNDLNDQRQYLVISHNIWITAANPEVQGLCDSTNPDGVKLRCVLNGRPRFDGVSLAQ